MSTKKNIINTRANLIRMKASTLCLTLRKIRKPNEIETGEPTDDYETMTNSNKNIARYWYARECGLSHCMCGLVYAVWAWDGSSVCVCTRTLLLLHTRLNCQMREQNNDMCTDRGRMKQLSTKSEHTYGHILRRRQVKYDFPWYCLIEFIVQFFFGCHCMRYSALYRVGLVRSISRSFRVSVCARRYTS